MKKIMKYITIIAFAVCIILSVKLALFLFTNQTHFYMTKSQTVWDATTTQKIIDLPDLPYNCKIMMAVIGDNINYCKLADARPVVFGQPMVMGDFNSLSNKIRITKETTNDAVVHEFIHYAISCARKTKDEELCVRSAQKMLLELNIIRT